MGKNNYEEMYKSFFHCDNVHEEFCKNCGKKWMAMEASPGDDYYCDVDGNVGKEWVANCNDENPAFKFIACTCGFPLFIEYHTDKEWESQSTDYFMKEEDFFKKIRSNK